MLSNYAQKLNGARCEAPYAKRCSLLRLAVWGLFSFTEGLPLSPDWQSKQRHEGSNDFTALRMDVEKELTRYFIP